MPASSRTPHANRVREPWGHGPVPSFISAVFGAAVTVRNAVYDSSKRFSSGTGRPTISVGGLSAGGTGKTPMALLVGRYALRRGYEVAFLSRGYGRKTTGTAVSAPGDVDTWEKVGDEPAMLHEALPSSWLAVGGDRRKAALALTRRLGPKAVFIMDDGFQHRRLKRDMDIVCLPPDPFADSLLPSGSLRENLNALKRAHCACLIGNPEESALLESSREKIAHAFPHCPVFILHQTPAGWASASSGRIQTSLPLKRPVAICGIARPQRFIFFLKKLHIPVSAEGIFSDHHEFSSDEIETLLKRAGSSGIVTTEKDAIRLKSLRLVSGPDIWYLKLDIRFSENDSEEHFYRLIDKALC
jgi:tetraacyldisaccharide 4'-kinase